MNLSTLFIILQKEAGRQYKKADEAESEPISDREDVVRILLWWPQGGYSASLRDTSDLAGGADPPLRGAFACAKEILVFEPGVLTASKLHQRKRQPFGCLFLWWTQGGSNP